MCPSRHRKAAKVSPAKAVTAHHNRTTRQAFNGSGTAEIAVVEGAAPVRTVATDGGIVADAVDAAVLVAMNRVKRLNSSSRP